jgi:hypothetical protein
MQENQNTNNTPVLLSDLDKQWETNCKFDNMVYKKLPSQLGPQRRIIVLGDIHGDFDLLVDFLDRATVINKNNPDIWIGGDTKVVQVGDQIDSRNRLNNHQPEEYSDIKILYYLTKLHDKAELVGGAIYSLLGNHELMNVYGDLRYVSDKSLVDHADEKRYSDIQVGKAERMELFKPGNKLSRFLACTRQVAIIIGDHLFVHGGILPEISSKYKITDINRLMTLYLWGVLNDKDLTDYNTIFMNPNISPLWTRDFANINPTKYTEECDRLMTPLLEMYNVGKIFVGHTVLNKEKITTGCNDKNNNPRIYYVDTGASHAMRSASETNNIIGKRTLIPGARVLEILKDKNTGQYTYNSL